MGEFRQPEIGEGVKIFFIVTQALLIGQVLVLSVLHYYYKWKKNKRMQGAITKINESTYERPKFDNTSGSLIVHEGRYTGRVIHRDLREISYRGQLGSE